MLVRLLRDSTLLAWILIVSGLIVVLAVARVVGAGHPMPAAGDNGRNAVVAASSSHAARDVDTLRALAPAGLAAGHDVAALTSWAAQVGAAATTGAQVRAREGADETDQLTATFVDINTEATALAQHAGDRVAASSLRTRIFMLFDRAYALVEGMPVPDTLPQVPGDPYGAPDRGPLPDQLPTPLPRSEPTATAPVSPTPGPHLDLSKPNPKELR